MGWGTLSGARHLVGDEPFAVLLPDDVIAADKPCLQQMIEAYAQTGGNMIAAMEVAPDKASSYGIMDVPPAIGPILPMSGMVEKPAPGTQPSIWQQSGAMCCHRMSCVTLTRSNRVSAGKSS